AGSLALSLNTVLIYIFIVPCILIYIRGSDRYIILVIVSTFIFDTIRYFSPTSKKVDSIYWKPVGNPKGNDAALFAISIISTIVLPCILKGGQIALLINCAIPVGRALAYFDKICPSNRRYGVVFVIIGIYLISIISYISCHWSGFGRIVIGAYIM